MENYHKVVEAIRSLVEKSGEMFLVGRIQECVESTVDEDYETWLDEATDCVYSDVDRRSITY